MALGVDRDASRADTLLFIGCVLLSVSAMVLPDRIRDPVARAMRQTVLAPLLSLQEQSQLLVASLSRYQTVVSQRDSATLAATFVPELRSENTRLRALLGLGQRLNTGYIAAEVLHQALPTDPLTLLLSGGKRQGVRALSPVVSPEGLVGIVSSVDQETSIALTWANPEFRASAMAADGSVYGIVAPHGAEGPGSWLLELRGVPYRQLVPDGTEILTSGLGGVFPRGIPIGAVIGLAREAEGWERTYLVRPAVHPAAVSHVMVLTSPRPSADMHAAFVPPPPPQAPPTAPGTAAASPTVSATAP